MVRVGHRGEPDGARVAVPCVWHCGTPGMRWRALLLGSLQPPASVFKVLTISELHSRCLEVLFLSEVRDINECFHLHVLCLVHNVVGKDKQFKPLSNNAMRSRLNDWTAKYNMQKCSEFSLFNLNTKCHSVCLYCFSSMSQCFIRAARRLPLLSTDRYAR